MSDNYERGRRDFERFCGCRSYLSLAPPEKIPAKEAMRLFWPPAKEFRDQIRRPLDPDRAEWIRGFEDAQRSRILARCAE